MTRLAPTLLLTLALLYATPSRAQTTSSPPPPSEDEIKLLIEKNELLRKELLKESDLRLIEQGRRLQAEKESSRMSTQLVLLGKETGKAQSELQAELTRMKRWRIVWAVGGTLTGALLVGSVWHLSGR